MMTDARSLFENLISCGGRLGEPSLPLRVRVSSGRDGAPPPSASARRGFRKGSQVARALRARAGERDNGGACACPRSEIAGHLPEFTGHRANPHAKDGARNS